MTRSLPKSAQFFVGVVAAVSLVPVISGGLRWQAHNLLPMLSLMAATVLTSKIDENSDAFRRHAAHNRGLAEELRAKVAEAALGGNEKSRERHVSRGKLLPRDRVEPTCWRRQTLLS